MAIRSKGRSTCCHGELTSCGMWPPSPDIRQLGIDTLSDDTLLERQYPRASLLDAIVTFVHVQSLNYQLYTGPRQQLSTARDETGSPSRSKIWTGNDRTFVQQLDLRSWRITPSKMWQALASNDADFYFGESRDLMERVTRLLTMLAVAKPTTSAITQ